MAYCPLTTAETDAINRLYFLAPVSGTCAIQIWDRIRLVFHWRRFERCSIPSQKVACM